jgi:outer membrane protein OmpA-like peptidoglycan-associated protein
LNRLFTISTLVFPLWFTALCLSAQVHTDFKIKNFPGKSKTDFTKALTDFKEGEKAYRALKEGKSTDMESAIQLLESAFAFNPNHIRINRYLTDLYLSQNQSEKTLPHLEKLYDLKAELSQEELFLLGSLLQYKGSFHRAEFVFGEFKNTYGNILFWSENRLQTPAKRIAECKKGQEMAESKSRFAQGKNFMAQEFSPDIEHLFYNHFYGWWALESGNYRLLTSREKRRVSDLKLTPSEFLYADINGRVLLASDDSLFRDISPVKLLDLEALNGKFHNREAFISADLRKIYFSSDRPGGKGGYDIWIAHFEPDGKLKGIENMGDEVNDEFDQFAPTFSADEERFFCSSNGKHTTGGFDILYAEKEALKEGKPMKNIGLGLNSGKDETGILFDITGTKGFIRRNHKGTTGFIPFRETESVREALFISAGYETAAGVLLDPESYEKKTAQSLISQLCKLRLQIKPHAFGKGVLEIFDLKTGNTLYRSGIQDTTRMLSLLVPATGNYGLHFLTEKGLPFSARLQLKTEEIFMEREVLIDPAPLKKNRAIVLNNIVFSRDYLEMNPESEFEIQRISTWLKENPKVKIEVAVHTDALSMHGVAIAAGESAANQIFELFKKNGIEKKRLDWMFYGAEKPLFKGNGAESDARNRRVELIITDEK